MKIAFKIIGNDIRKNPLSYIVLLLSVLVCAVVALFFARAARKDFSTAYDNVYSFEISNLGGYEEAEKYFENIRYR